MTARAQLLASSAMVAVDLPPAPVVTSTTTGGSTDWALKTPEQILDDVRAAIATSGQQYFEELEIQRRWLLSERAFHDDYPRKI